MGSPSLQIGHVMVLPLDALGIIADVVALDDVGVGGSPCVPLVPSVPSMTVFPTDHHLNKCAYNIYENLYTHVRAMP